jgi:hypothetical protein
MGKRKLSAGEKAAKKKRRREYQTIFIDGKMKRVRRPPTIDGMRVEDFVRQNADPIFLHQEGLWEYLEAPDDDDPPRKRTPIMTDGGRESVSFITVEFGDNLIVAYAIATGRLGEIVSLILQRSPRYEHILPPEERGVMVSHEVFLEDDRDLLKRIVVDGPEVDIETTRRAYRIDLSAVDPEEVMDAWKVLRQMHHYGGFDLDLR